MQKCTNEWSEDLIFSRLGPVCTNSNTFRIHFAYIEFGIFLNIQFVECRIWYQLDGRVWVVLLRHQTDATTFQPSGSFAVRRTWIEVCKRFDSSIEQFTNFRRPHQRSDNYHIWALRHIQRPINEWYEPITTTYGRCVTNGDQSTSDTSL